MRVLVTGGRFYSDKEKVFQSLHEINIQTPIKILVHGGATGADSHANSWAVANQVTVEKHPVTKQEWATIGKSAGPKRNKKMAELGADLLVAFPGGSGTWDMVKQATAANIFVCDTEDGSIFQQYKNIKIVLECLRLLDELHKKHMLGSEEAERIRCLSDEPWRELTEQQANVFRFLGEKNERTNGTTKTGLQH